jgi:glutathione S-transferase
LWTLEEMGIDYDVVEMQFPPRVHEPGYKDMNVLGTVPYFVDGQVHMTESSGICDYLTQRYQHTALRLEPEHPEFGDFLNWLYMSDATLLFPQTLVLRYSQLEPEERRSQQVVNDYRHWFLARLKKLDQHIIGRDYLCANRFTIADIAVGYALYLGRALKFEERYKPQTAAYLQRMMERPAFKRADEQGEPLQLPTME